MVSRDEFSATTKRILADRVGHRCSNPGCRASTCGPQVDPVRSMNVGVAAHITAAAQGGPRYDPSRSPAQRTHPTNGIWLCQNCAKLIDNDSVAFDEATLRSWKTQAEAEAFALVGHAVRAFAPSAGRLSEEEAELLIACAAQGEIARFSAAQCGDWVRAGGRDFVDLDDAAVAAVYLDALEGLIAKRLCRYEAGILYVLTGTGFKVARRLKDFMAGEER